jgi:hypothetical protein
MVRFEGSANIAILEILKAFKAKVGRKVAGRTKSWAPFQRAFATTYNSRTRRITPFYVTFHYGLLDSLEDLRGV